MYRGIGLFGGDTDYEWRERLTERYAKKIVYIAVGNIKKGSILKDNNIRLYYDNGKKGKSYSYREKIDNIIKLGKPFLGLRAIVDIAKEEELKLTFFEDAELQIERDKVNKNKKNRIKLQIKNNLWL